MPMLVECKRCGVEYQPVTDEVHNGIHTDHVKEFARSVDRAIAAFDEFGKAVQTSPTRAALKREEWSDI